MKPLQTLGWSTLLLATSAAAQDTVKCLDKPVNTTFIHHNVPYLVVDDERKTKPNSTPLNKAPCGFVPRT